MPVRKIQLCLFLFRFGNGICMLSVSDLVHKSKTALDQMCTDCGIWEWELHSFWGLNARCYYGRRITNTCCFYWCCCDAQNSKDRNRQTLFDKINGCMQCMINQCPICHTLCNSHNDEFKLYSMYCKYLKYLVRFYLVCSNIADGGTEATFFDRSSRNMHLFSVSNVGEKTETT